MAAPASLSDRRSRLRSCSLVLSSPKPKFSVEDAAAGLIYRRIYEEADTGSPFPENVVDRDYRNFLNHLKVHRTSYVLEMMVGNPPRYARLKYEEVEEHEEEEGRWPGSGCVVFPTFTGVEKLVKIKKVLKSDSPAMGLNESRDFEEDKVVDKSYKYFLDNVRIQGGSMVLVLPNNSTVKYDGKKEEVENGDGKDRKEEKSQIKEEEGESENSVKQSTVSSKDSSTRPFSITNTAAYQSYMESVRYRAPSFFRNNLIDTLSKPFSKSEYEDLMVLSRARSPQVKLKHLRSDSIPYKTGKLGCSYFDYFPDFAKEVGQADCYKGLALMRGFFFWLKNLSHDGAFLPWLSSSSMYQL